MQRQHVPRIAVGLALAAIATSGGMPLDTVPPAAAQVGAPGMTHATAMTVAGAFLAPVAVAGTLALMIRAVRRLGSLGWGLLTGAGLVAAAAVAEQQALATLVTLLRDTFAT